VNPESLSRTLGSFAVGILLLIGGAAVLWHLRPEFARSLIDVAAPAATPARSEQSFNETYLDALAGRATTRRTNCQACHELAAGLVEPRSSVLNRRGRQSREAWATELVLQGKCGICHALPDPAHLPQQSWREIIARMEQVMELRGVVKPTTDELQDVLHFYLTFSREQQPRLADEPDPAESPVQFQPTALGLLPSNDSRERPILGHVNIVDLNRDGQPDLLTCDVREGAVKWVHRQNGRWEEGTLAKAPFPGRARVLPSSEDRNPDLVVACLGALLPTDDPVGSVVLLINEGPMHFTVKTILEGVGRVADVEPGDFDGDGDLDFVVAAYGHINRGEVGWLENRGDGTYSYHPTAKRGGAMNVPPIDLDGDGDLDFVALFAQEHELVSAFLNGGKGGFQERVLFKAGTPAFGSSGIRLVDLDRDGDPDVLYVNGDNSDLPTITPRPYHGVQWLENRGGLNFVWHDLHRCYGPYDAVAGDLNNDGHLDIVVASMFNDWSDPKRASLIWLENDGQQRFRPHAIAREPIHLISVALADLDRDGRTDIVTCGMNGFPPFERMSRITWWKNRHK
jgi:hypothetical protein